MEKFDIKKIPRKKYKIIETLIRSKTSKLYLYQIKAN